MKWNHGEPMNRTVSSSDYHSKCADCVEKDRRIDNLQAQLVSERESHALSSGFTSMTKGERDRLYADVKVLATLMRDIGIWVRGKEHDKEYEIITEMLSRSSVRKIVEESK